jgi:hypothetical protein
MDTLYVGLSAFGGGVILGLVGWIESKEKFDARKFGGTVLRSLLGGAVLAGGGYFTDTVVTAPILTSAFLAGAGIDVGLKRIAGSMK